MKTFKKFAAQGEIRIKKIDRLPDGLRPVCAVDNNFVIGHSETGHHHVIKERPGVQVFEATRDVPAGMRVLYALLEESADLEHLRDYDTHETVRHDPGMYEFRIGREHDHYAAAARAQAD